MKSGACKGLLRKRGLLQSVTQAEFGLALCDDDGAGMETDGVVVEAVPHMVNVRIRRLMHHSRITDQQRALLAAG